MTDPADDGLRMPLPLASMKIKKPKKKKKWSQQKINKSDFLNYHFHLYMYQQKLIFNWLKKYQLDININYYF